MTKVLSQAGISLSDVYDVEGSIVGIEELEAREVALVHEMGGTIFSERLSGAIRRISSGVLADSDTFDITISDLPAVPTRILNVAFASSVGGRIADAALYVSGSRTGGREIPLKLWDASEAIVTCRFSEDGDAAADFNFLVSTFSDKYPSMLIGVDQPQAIDQMTFRGTATAFGAGAVTVFAYIYVAFGQIGGISSKGLPVPGW